MNLFKVGKIFEDMFIFCYTPQEEIMRKYKKEIQNNDYVVLEDPLKFRKEEYQTLMDRGLLTMSYALGQDILHKPLTNEQIPQVGDKFMVRFDNGYGDLVSRCAKELLQLFYDNPKRFREFGYVTNYGLMDTETGLTFHEYYDFFEMSSKINQQEHKILVMAIRNYYMKRRKRLQELKLKRKERIMIKHYCKCED